MKICQIRFEKFTQRSEHIFQIIATDETVLNPKCVSKKRRRMKKKSFTRSWSMMLNASLYSWICDWSNIAKIFDVARCWRFFGGFAFARDAMLNRSMWIVVFKDSRSRSLYITFVFISIEQKRKRRTRERRKLCLTFLLERTPPQTNTPLTFTLHSTTIDDESIRTCSFVRSFWWMLCRWFIYWREEKENYTGKCSGLAMILI